MSILTQDEADIIRNKLEDFKLAIYKTDFDSKKYVDENFTESEKAFVLKDLKVSGDSNDMRESIDKLLKDISGMKLVLVKVAFDPPVSFISWLKEFFAKKTSETENIVIKVESDKSMLAGVILEFRGKVKDESAKANILNILSSDTPLQE